MRLELRPPEPKVPKYGRKRWVRDLLAKRDALERAIGMPVGELLGCGHFGCVFQSDPPWVVKLTVDPSEGPIWDTIQWAIDENGGYGGTGFARVAKVVRLRPDVGEGRRKRALYAIVREEVAPVFATIDGQVLESDETLEQIGLAEWWKSAGLEQRSALAWSSVRNEDWPTHRARDFARTLDGLRHYLDAGRAQQALDAYRRLRTQRTRYAAARALDYYNLVQYDPNARWVTSVPKPDAQEIIVHRASRAADEMVGGVGGYLGESLSMLAGMNIVLRDVHLMNIGWRLHECVSVDGDEDCSEPGAIVIFDPGHTPTERPTEIEERMIANARWPG